MGDASVECPRADSQSSRSRLKPLFAGVDRCFATHVTKSERLEIHVLGPLEVWIDGDAVPLAGGKQRAVLAMLSLRAGEVVSSGQLVDELWGEVRLPRPAHTRGYVSRIRQLFRARPVLVRRGTGYLLELGDAWCLTPRDFTKLRQETPQPGSGQPA